MRFRQATWGEVIAGYEAHIEYLERVRAQHVEKSDFRGRELRDCIRLLGATKAAMKTLGKTKRSAFWPQTAESAIARLAETEA